jgi:hypothetical protein
LAVSSFGIFAANTTSSATHSNVLSWKVKTKCLSERKRVALWPGRTPFICSIARIQEELRTSKSGYQNRGVRCRKKIDDIYKYIVVQGVVLSQIIAVKRTIIRFRCDGKNQTSFVGQAES